MWLHTWCLSILCGQLKTLFISYWHWINIELDWLFAVCGFWHFLQILLFSAGAPRVSHPFLLLRDVLLCGRVAHPLPQPTTAGLSCLEVGVSRKGIHYLLIIVFSLSITFSTIESVLPDILLVTTNTCTNHNIIWLKAQLFHCDAGIWADLWWAVQDSTTQQPSWMLTSWRSVKKKAGANWLSISCHSSTISTGTK